MLALAPSLLAFALALAAPTDAPAPANPIAPANPAANAPAPASPIAPPADAPAKELPQAHPLSLHATLDHEQITLGQSFALTVEVVHDAGDTYSLPPELAAALAKGSLVLRGEPQVSRAPDQAPPGSAPSATPLAKTTLRIPLADVASMKPSVPALTLDVQGPSGPRKLDLPEQPLTVESLVAKENEPNPEHAHHGPKPPEQIKVRSYLWLWLLLGLAAVASAIFAFDKYRKRKAERAEAPPPPEPPESEAMRRLRDLRARAPWQAGEGRAAIFEVSEIVRAYLGKELRFNAADLTSEELLHAMAARAFPGFDLTKFAERSRWEDLVKFAKLEPSGEECVSALDAAVELVQLTRAKLEAQRRAELAAAAAAKQVGTPNIGTPTNSPGGAR